MGCSLDLGFKEGDAILLGLVVVEEGLPQKMKICLGVRRTR